MLKKKQYRAKTPVIYQMEAVECGAASLAIILAYYGCYIPLEKLRAECGVSRDGSRADNVMNVGESYGMTVDALEVDELDDLKNEKMPMIAFWGFNHFLVIEGFKNNKWYLNDPATGPRAVSEEEFNDNFTGVVLTFEPSAAFKKQGKPFSVVSRLKERMEGAYSALTFIILASLFLVIPGIIVPGFSKIFIDDILIKSMNNWIVPLILGMLSVAIIQGILIWMQQYYILKLTIKLSFESSVKFMSHLLHLPMPFFEQRFAGDIQERVASNFQIATLLSTDVMASFVNLIAIVFYIIVMFFLSLPLTLIVLLSVSLNLLLLSNLTEKIANASRRFLDEKRKLAGIEAYILEIVETIKGMGVEYGTFDRWASQHAKTINSQQSIFVLSEVLVIVPGLVKSLMTVAIVGFGAWQIMKGDLTAGSLVAFLALSEIFYSPVETLLGFADKFQQVRADMAMIADVEDQPKDIFCIEKASAIEEIKGHVEISNLTFGYSTMDEPVIREFNMSVKPGQKVAIVGRSGSGKSTVSRLLMGLYQPWDGEIKIDGVPLMQISREVLAKNMTLVEQDSMLFEASVAENVSLWNENMAQANIRQALEDVDIYNEIEHRSGLEMYINEMGANLSGGQRQRLELARALASRPKVLVLDEATSALDPAVEKYILDKIDEYNFTLIVISHRLSAVRDCDEIIVMHHGDVVERGTHQELMSGKYYPELYRLDA
ncbi:MAG: NHLP family bacteriocin export ABC transporter peptidase/permease/ATPase subunit [Gammaproteobacteria bacterium]